MTAYNEKTKRNVVPRWRSSTVAASSKDFRPLRARGSEVTIDGQLLGTQIEQFELAPDLGRAAELLATAIRENQTERAIQAAHFIHVQGAQAPNLLMGAALSILNGTQAPFLTEQITESSAAIARLRALLKIRPRSAALWIDLARFQATLGNTNKAIRSMRVGLALAPNHRWVIRSANRLLLHAGDPEAAHKLLASHPRTRHDPWLISAELASAELAKKPPRFLREARDMLRRRSLLPAQVSELAAAVATMEMEAGSGKTARKLLRIAIEDPTENALAQVEWAERESRAGLELRPVISRTPDAFEASCWLKYNDGQIQDALIDAQEWLQDESYANRPVGMVCYLASFLDDYALVIKTAREALARHPAEVLHRNNLIFGLLSAGYGFDRSGEGELIDHIEFLRRRIGTKEGNVFHEAANAGLLFYRIGRPEDGKQLYEAAIEFAKKGGNQLSAANAAVMNSREAILSRSPWAPAALAGAHELTKLVVSPGLRFYLRKLDALAANPGKAGEILTPGAARTFSLQKPQDDFLKGLRFENTESGPILWVPRHLMKR